jgi:two-component system nitrogen regulation sensor histidine kinase GlnL
LKPSSIHEHIIENLGEGLIGIDRSMIINVYNQLAEKITGISRSLSIGRPIAEVMQKNIWIVEMAEKTIRKGKVYAEYEGKLYQNFENTIPVLITTSPLLDSDGNPSGVIVLLKEISGIRLLEVDSIRKDRLAIIGTFAAGIAHEVRNPLGGIKGAAQLLSRSGKDKDIDEYTKIIVRETDRLNNILEDILNFANPKDLKLKAINIHEVLDSAMKMVPLPKDISILLEYDPSLPPILGDNEQLTQVFINLIKNAAEAIDKSGEVKILTRMVTDFHLIESGYKGIKIASIEIRDNGCGIPSDNLDKIFTPFFTTKPKGTGLGIALSFRIIKEHGGFFRIESSLDKGTNVFIYLPIAEEYKDEG